MNHRMRKEFFKAIIRQDIGWFDKNQSGTLTAKLFELVAYLNAKKYFLFNDLFEYNEDTVSHRTKAPRATKSSLYREKTVKVIFQ